MDEKPQEGRKRDQYVAFWVSHAGFDAIEGARGTWSRSEYIRQALMLAAKQGLKGPPPGRIHY